MTNGLHLPCDKKLRKGELRYIARKVDKKWRVYDKARGSYPYSGAAYGGAVKQDVTEEEAELEAARLNELVGIETVQAEAPEEVESSTINKKKAPAKKRTAKKTETIQPVDEPLPELPDYGVMGEEERKKYEDGLLEKVSY